ASDFQNLRWNETHGRSHGQLLPPVAREGGYRLRWLRRVTAGSCTASSARVRTWVRSQAAKSASGREPSARARYTGYSSWLLACNIAPLSTRNASQATPAVRLLPSTNGWLRASPNARLAASAEIGRAHV